MEYKSSVIDSRFREGQLPKHYVKKESNIMLLRDQLCSECGTVCKCTGSLVWGSLAELREKPSVLFPLH